MDSLCLNALKNPSPPHLTITWLLRMFCIVIKNGISKRIHVLFDDPRDVEDSKRAFISKSFKEDRGIWIYSKDGNLTTKLAYNFLINEDLNQNGSDVN